MICLKQCFSIGFPAPKDSASQSRGSTTRYTNATNDGIFELSPVQICEQWFLERLECILGVSLHQKKLKNTGLQAPLSIMTCLFC